MVITMTLKPLLPVSALLAMTLALTGCFDSDKKKNPAITFNDIAIVQSVGSGESMLEFTNGIDQVISGFHSKTATDYRVFARGDYFYHVGRFEIDTIQKYHIDNPTLGYYPNDGFSLRKAGDSSSANPYNIGFLDDNTAIITRYGSTSAWVVNLAATQFDDFFIRELDLSHHATGENATGENDTIPEMDMVFVYNNKVFITLQNLTEWQSTGNERVVVFDATTWDEIDTDSTADGTQAIALNLTNHQSGTRIGNTLYLGSLDYSTLGGGLEAVNLDTYTTTTITDEYAVNLLTSTDSGRIFFTSYEGWQDNTLYTLNGDTVQQVSDELVGMNLSAMAASGDVLWLGTSGETNTLHRLDAAGSFSQTQALVDITLSQVELAFKPISIAFMQIEETQLDIEVPEDNTAN